MADLLTGKKGLITGFANAESIAFGIAKAVYQEGASLVCSYGHPKAVDHVEPLAGQLGDAPMLFADVRDEQSLNDLFDQTHDHLGQLDFVVHSIAFAPLEDLHGRVTDCSRDGFLTAMDISCHSFIRMAQRAELLMPHGGTLLTMSYYGSDKVVPNYNLMGPVKAALESSVRYLADELGPSGIRVHALSPGPIATRAASGIKGFEQMQRNVIQRSPLNRLTTQQEVGEVAAFLVSDKASGMTGSVTYVDSGYNVVG